MNIAKGGTELMAERINTLPPKLLEPFQIIHSRVREILPNKKKILVLHDLAEDPEVAHLAKDGWKNFDKLVFVSNWQQARYNQVLGVPYEAGVVLHNAIEPFVKQAPLYSDGPVKLIYTSTPHRGLNILYAAFEDLCNDYDFIELKVFSSFGLYGWPERDVQFEPLFDLCRKHPKITYSGAVSNATIRRELLDSHIFVYPSTWQETSCLCLIEAMAAGLTCVHSSLAALPETAMNLTDMYGYVENPNLHVEKLCAALDEAILATTQGSTPTPAAVNLMNAHYSLNRRLAEWESLLVSLT